MTPLKCSGLVTLVTISKTTNLETEFLSIPKGTDFATIEDHNRYVDYVLNRKALIVDVIFFIQILQSLFEFNLISKTVYLCIFHFNIFRQNCMGEKR